MRETDKEVLHRMCNKIRLSDSQKEDIMKKINEEVSGKKRAFNVRRFAAVAASVLALISTTVFVEAKFGIVDRISNLYDAWQSGDVILNEEEKAVIDEISLDVGCEFKVEGGKVRVDGIMYDSLHIYLMYTSIADDGNPLTAAGLFVPEFGTGGLKLIINGDLYSGGSSATNAHIDMEAEEEGHQGCYVFSVEPIQSLKSATGEFRTINNFSLSQGDEIILTAGKYINNNFSISHSMDDVEKIYGTFTLTKAVNELVFTWENTDGMEVLETITEIRVSPISVAVMGNELLRKTYPEGDGYKYIERNGKMIRVGATGDSAIDSSISGYAVSVVKKDGTVAEYGMDGASQGRSVHDDFEYFCSLYDFEKPLDLTEVDYVLVKGWGQELKIPVNVE